MYKRTAERIVCHRSTVAVSMDADVRNVTIHVEEMECGVSPAEATCKISPESFLNLVEPTIEGIGCRVVKAEEAV